MPVWPIIKILICTSLMTVLEKDQGALQEVFSDHILNHYGQSQTNQGLESMFPEFLGKQWCATKKYIKKMDPNEYQNIFECHIIYRRNIQIYITLDIYLMQQLNLNLYCSWYIDKQIVEEVSKHTFDFFSSSHEF